MIGDVTRTAPDLSATCSPTPIKFTASGTVALSVDAECQGGTMQVSLSVRDTGIGFDEAAHGRLFQRFEQADGSITRRYGGTGLGLSISRSLAEAMGGGLEATSIPGEGAVFTLKLALPLATDEACRDRARAGRPAVIAGARRRVLLAEDHPTNRARGAADPGGDRRRPDLRRERRRRRSRPAARQTFDLVLMDMQMPVMDGLTAIRAIRASEAGPGATRDADHLAHRQRHARAHRSLAPGRRRRPPHQADRRRQADRRGAGVRRG